MPDYQGKKFQEYLRKNGIPIVQAHKMLGVSRNQVYQYFSSTNLERETVNKIVLTFKTTEEDIFGPLDKKLKLEAKPIRLADPYGFEATNERIYKLPDESLIMQVPVIPFKAWGSYMRGHADPEFYDGLETMPVPVNAAHKGSYLIFETGGESMLNPGSRKCIWPGEKLIGRDLRREHWKYKLHINSNQCWIIVHKDGIVVKEITHHDIDTGIITLHSWNPDKQEHPDYDVSLEDVEQIFNVVDPFNKFG